MNSMFQNPCNIFGLIALKLITTPACIIDYIKTLGTYMYLAAEHTQWHVPRVLPVVACKS